MVEASSGHSGVRAKPRRQRQRVPGVRDGAECQRWRHAGCNPQSLAARQSDSIGNPQRACGSLSVAAPCITKPASPGCAQYSGGRLLSAGAQVRPSPATISRLDSIALAKTAAAKSQLRRLMRDLDQRWCQGRGSFLPRCENCFPLLTRTLPLCSLTGNHRERQRLFSKLLLFNHID